MPEAYVIDAVRTPFGRRGGALADVHPGDLGAHVIRGLLTRTDVDPTNIDDVIIGNVDSVGPQAGNLARTCALAAGLPESVPGVTIDRQCGSSQQAVHFASQAVMSGTQDLVIAGGVQSMSQVPIIAAVTAGEPLGHPTPYAGCLGWQERYPKQEINQFRGAEMIAERWGISRPDMEAFALASHQRAARAIRDGHLEPEIAPLSGIEVDEGVRQDASIEAMSRLPAIMEPGRITAATASQISDGAAALLIASDDAVRRHGLTPRARVHHLEVGGDDPIMMLSAPIPVTRRALERTGLDPSDIDVAECNEAFASVVLAWMAETGFVHEQVNVNGGSLALGHPLGATGARLVATLVTELERTGGRYGLATMCEGGGTANVTIIERL